MRVLGIDPGSNATGFGIVERHRSGLIHISHGVLRPKRGTPLAQRLAFLHNGVAEIIREYAPDGCAIEKVFVATSPGSALVLGQARGAVLAAMAGAQLEIAELAAREVKKGVVGTGAATKEQVTAMVVRILSLDTAPPTDAADALAIAISHAHAGPLAALGARTGSKRRRRRFTAADIAARSHS